MNSKSFFGLSDITVMMLSGACKKNRTENNPIVNPSGKWVSIAYSNGTRWVGDVMPHHFNFKTDMNFDFRESGIPNCSGLYSTKYIGNSSTLIKFLSPGCGLTDRITENLTADTLILTVLNPLNVTKEKVKYAKEP